MIWYIDIMQQLSMYYIYPRVMLEVNVSTTVEMSATVGEMSAKVEEMSATVGERPRQDWRLPFITLLRIHGITCQKNIRI